MKLKILLLVLSLSVFVFTIIYPMPEIAALVTSSVFLWQSFAILSTLNAKNVNLLMPWFVLSWVVNVTACVLFNSEEISEAIHISSGILVILMAGLYYMIPSMNQWYEESQRI